MKYEYAIIEVTPYNRVGKDNEELNSYGEYGYKVVGVYQTKNQQGFNVGRIILMREAE